MHFPQMTRIQQPNRRSSVVGGCFSVLVDNNSTVLSLDESRLVMTVAHVQQDSREGDDDAAISIVYFV